jgi:hypothetical protein
MNVTSNIAVMKATFRIPLPGDTVVMTGAAGMNGATADEDTEVAEVPWATFVVCSSTVYVFPLVRPVMAIGDVVPVAVKKDPVPFRRYCIAVMLNIVVVKATLRKALPDDTVVMTGAAG